MSKGQRKALAVVGGACSIAAGYAAYRKSRKWDVGSAANVIGGAVMIARAVLK